MINKSALKLRRDNPYSKGVIYKFSDNTPALLRGKLVYTESPKDQYYAIEVDDRLDTIAFKFYGNSKLWWVLADCNNIIDPFLLEVGSNIVIPNLDILKANNLI